MNVFKSVLFGLILFSFMSCEHAEKKAAPKKRITKTEIRWTPKASSLPHKDKTRRIITPEIPLIRIEPEPDPRPYYVGEPTVPCPTSAPFEIKTDSIYDYPAVMPEFPGGQQALMNFLKTNLVYPEDAKELGIEGKVFVSFVIFEDGSVQHVSILRGINGNISCEKEVLRLIKRMPLWIPGQNEFGEKIKARMKIPVVFRLD
jgi:TonB family protein